MKLIARLPAAAVVLAAIASTAYSGPPTPVDRGGDGEKAYTVGCSIAASMGIRVCAELPSGKACLNERGNASPKGQSQPATMPFVNRSGGQIKVFWLDFNGSRTLYQTLQANYQYDQPTYYGHNWLVTNADGYCVGIYRGAPQSIAIF